ncbi:hypothetical protein H5410_015765 [Solanum commersonii]|uniref:Peptidase A1 domain-containing protein n=1 Tax=Solanum commersonii TaxID=4109 RepID=A0A9J5ZUE1_SOLCO|nr:hypothetical protein H5410_015765 [Solanum commersonii]
MLEMASLLTLSTMILLIHPSITHQTLNQIALEMPFIDHFHVFLFSRRVPLLPPTQSNRKLSIGTPVEIVDIADTGSDLTWTQCKPCVNCFQQSLPLFDSKKSSTYKIMGCDVEVCTSLGSSSCVGGNICEYQMSYGDRSNTIGDLGFDKFTFPSTSGKNVMIPNVAFGCGHDNGGTFNNYTSGVSVGNKTLEFKSSMTSPSDDASGDHGQAGNIIIDSGTTLTLLPNYFYSNLESTFMDSIHATRKDDPSGTFHLCYESENGTINAPTIVTHFTNADLELSPMSTFAEIEKGLVCLTIVPTYEIAIFGNLAQENFLIGYDLVANKISFQPTGCTKY